MRHAQAASLDVVWHLPEVTELSEAERAILIERLRLLRHLPPPRKGEVLTSFGRHLARELEAWEREYGDTNLDLRLEVAEGLFVIVDTRGLPHGRERWVLDAEDAMQVMTSQKFTGQALLADALEHQVGILVEDPYVPDP